MFYRKQQTNLKIVKTPPNQCTL